MDDDKWKLKVVEFCKEYNVPLDYLADTLYDPKVTPMIRGKAFEYSAMIALRAVLPPDEWEVSKPFLNPQLGSHDMDLKIVHKPTGKVIRLECKLAAKESFRLYPDGHAELRVKCMRSRTLGPQKVKELAPKFGIAEEVLAIHNDQYIPGDFDVVLTSIGNAFYRTNPKTEVFEWDANERELEFLENLNVEKSPNLKDFAFGKLFLAKSSSLATSQNGVMCSRKKCMNKENCQFIPNYPKIVFDPGTYQPTNGWVGIAECESLFRQFLS